MLTPVAKSDMPAISGKPRTTIREFANETIREFLSTAKPNDIAEVTEWPDNLTAEKVCSEFRAECYLMYRTGQITAEDRDRLLFRRRGQRVFLMMEG